MSTAASYESVYANYRPEWLKKRLAPHREVLGGFFGGACGIFITHPLDTIRVRAQVASGGRNPSYLGIIRSIVRHKGITGFYAGVVPPVFFRGVGFSFNRYGYACAKQYTDNSCILGIIAGLCNAMADTPIFCLKNRVQCSNGQFKESIREYLRMGFHILKTEGLYGLYTGHVPNVILFCFSYALFYAVYDPMLSAGYTPCTSGVAAVLACWPLLYPFDVLRTRSQIVQKRTKWSRNYFTFRYFAREMWAQPVRRWFPGLGLTLVRAAPRYGVAMAVCESVKGTLED